MIENNNNNDNNNKDNKSPTANDDIITSKISITSRDNSLLERKTSNTDEIWEYDNNKTSSKISRKEKVDDMNNNYSNTKEVYNDKSNKESLISKANVTKIVDYNDINSDEGIKEEKYRWVIFVSFYLLLICSPLHMFTISSIAHNFKQAYNLSSVVVDIYTLLFSLFTPMFFLASYIIDNKSIRLGLNITAIMLMIGSFLKCFINKSIIISLIGQSMIAIVHPFSSCASGKIASVWFRAEIRARIATYLSLGNILGSVIGGIINLLFLPNTVTTDNKEEYKEKMFYYISFEFVLTVVLCLPSLFLIKSKPQNPPSLSQKQLNISFKLEPTTLKNNLKALFANKQYILFLIAASTMASYGISVVTISNEWLSSYNIYNPYTNIIGLITTLVGVISATILSKSVDNSKSCKSIFIKITIIGLIAECVLAVLSELGIKFVSDNLIYFWTFLSSITASSILPYYTIGLDYACEITYPVGEFLAGGMILFLAQLMSIFYVLLAEFFLNNLNKRIYIHYMCITLLVISLITISFFKEKLIRTKIDSNKQVCLVKDNIASASLDNNTDDVGSYEIKEGDYFNDQ